MTAGLLWDCSSFCCILDCFISKLDVFRQESKDRLVFFSNNRKLKIIIQNNSQIVRSICISQCEDVIRRAKTVTATHLDASPWFISAGHGRVWSAPVHFWSPHAPLPALFCSIGLYWKWFEIPGAKFNCKYEEWLQEQLFLSFSFCFTAVLPLMLAFTWTCQISNAYHNVTRLMRSK